MRRFLLIFMLAACVANAAAQDADYMRYRDSAQASSLLYRGRKPLAYKFQFNGTYYWDTPLYYSGTVRYNHKDYQCDAINIDAARQQALVIEPQKGAQVMLNRDYVESLTLDGRKFVNGAFLAPDILPEGYYEIIFDGHARIYKHVVKRLETVTNERLLDTGEKGTAVLRNVYDVYLPNVTFYYEAANGKITQIRRRGDLLKHYKEHRSALKKIIRAEETEYSIGLEEFILIVMRYVEYGE